MTLAQRHRQALCDAAMEAGPDGPTLCEGWLVKDLLTHLIVRDSRPDALLASALPQTQAHAAAVHADLAAAPMETLVERVRSGPPRWSPASVSRIDDVMNVAEFLVHTQDITRATPQVDMTQNDAFRTEDPQNKGAQTEGAQTEDPETDDAAWSLVRRAGRLFYRTSAVGVVVHSPGFGRAALRRPPRGAGSIVLTGAPVELLLHAFGRTGHCVVQVSGESDDVDG